MSQQKVESPLFQQGLKDGLPICLGYISVAFTFGMMATEGGLAPWSSLLISMTNLTSAGQFAGTALILSGGTLLEIAVTTFVINIRYMLMSLGTVLGATATGVLPLSVRSALGIAIYGMFIAIIIPPSREAKPVAITVVLAAALSCLFYYIPGLNQISSGWVIIICAVIAAGIMALRFPVDEETPPEEKEAA